MESVESANTACPGISSLAELLFVILSILHMPLEDVLPLPTNVAEAPKISGTIDVHMVETSFNFNGVC